MSDSVSLGVLLLILCMIAPLFGGLITLYALHRENRVRKPENGGELDNQLWSTMQSDYLRNGKGQG